MNKFLRIFLAIFIGLIVCLIVNGLCIRFGSTLVPPPEGVVVTDEKSLAENIDKFEPKHFVVPFIAHALGSLIGAMVAAAIATTRKITCALVIGVLHMGGGITMVILVPAPAWFEVLDLVVAYLPAAWLGGMIGKSLSRSAPEELNQMHLKK